SVEVQGQVSHAQAVRQMVEADILLLLDSPGRRMGVPAKLYEYLGAGRPVLALAEPDGDVARVLRESGVPSRLAPADSPAKIKQALVELMRDAAAGAFRFPGPEQLFPFTREHMAKQVAALLDQCLGQA